MKVLLTITPKGIRPPSVQSSIRDARAAGTFLQYLEPLFKNLDQIIKDYPWDGPEENDIPVEGVSVMVGITTEGLRDCKLKGGEPSIKFLNFLKPFLDELNAMFVYNPWSFEEEEKQRIQRYFQGDIDIEEIAGIKQLHLLTKEELRARKEKTNGEG